MWRGLRICSHTNIYTLTHLSVGLTCSSACAPGLEHERLCVYKVCIYVFLSLENYVCENPRVRIACENTLIHCKLARARDFHHTTGAHSRHGLCTRRVSVYVQVPGVKDHTTASQAAGARVFVLDGVVLVATLACYVVDPKIIHKQRIHREYTRSHCHSKNRTPARM